jgi:uncharacterized protein with HEPN domain
MSKRNWIILFEDLFSSIEKIESYTKDFSYNDFFSNHMVIDAVVRNIEIIGEIAKQIPDNIKNDIPEIPWKALSGIRNRIVHEYFNIDVSIIWQIITKDLPELKRNIKKQIDDNPQLKF